MLDPASVQRYFLEKSEQQRSENVKRISSQKPRAIILDGEKKEFDLHCLIAVLNF